MSCVCPFLFPNPQGNTPSSALLQHVPTSTSAMFSLEINACYREE
jgi:hypothetical protein